VTDYLLPVPGLGLLIVTAEELHAALSRGRAVLGQADIGIPPSTPKDGTSGALLDASEMAAATGVPASWFETAAREGLIPHHMFGRWRRFDYAEVFAASRAGIPRLRDMPRAPVVPLAKKLKRANGKSKSA
jgi:excisionase family DNA binding protein